MPLSPRPRRITPTTPLFMSLGEEPERPRVLVIDDEEAVRTAIASLLGRRGCEAVTAESGPAALERLRADPVRVCRPGLWSAGQRRLHRVLGRRDLPDQRRHQRHLRGAGGRWRDLQSEQRSQLPRPGVLRERDLQAVQSGQLPLTFVA